MEQKKLHNNTPLGGLFAFGKKTLRKKTRTKTRTKTYGFCRVAAARTAAGPLATRLACRVDPFGTEENFPEGKFSREGGASGEKKPDRFFFDIGFFPTGESQNSIGIARSFTRKQLIDYKNKLELTSEQKEVLIGTLLGDSSMSIRSDKPHYSVKFEQGEAHKDYVDHLYQIFEPYTGSPPSMRFIDSKKTRRAYWFRTYQHKHFMYYFHLFYVITPNHENVGNTPQGKISEGNFPKCKKVKIVPKNIHKYLTPRVLAYWFMDDGTFHFSARSKQKSYLFSTQGFQKHEVKRLCDALKYKFNIRANVVRDKKNWRIYILKESSPTFVDLIRPYIHQSFLYKI